jgi:hypothetical protein
MLRSMKDFEDYTIGATDGLIGRVKDFFFDDDAWVIRYLVVETDADHPRREVLISPIGIGQPNWEDKVLPVAVTRAQVRSSPDIDTNQPVSSQEEVGYLGYYGYGTYWGGGGLWGAGLYPDILQAGLQPGVTGRQGRANPHLRSGNAILRYYVHASDGDIGHVEGVLVDERSWAVRYLVVNTSNWWLGHQVIIAPEWIDHLSWAESKVYLDVTRQDVKDAPPYDSAVLLDRGQEASLHAHYGRPGYWSREAPLEPSAKSRKAG